MINPKLLQRVKDTLNNQENRISLRGYPRLTRADLDMVVMAVKVGKLPNHVAPIASKLYTDIMGLNHD